MTILWVVFIFIGINKHSVDTRLVIGSLAAAAYYFAASFYLHFKSNNNESIAEPLNDQA